MKSVEDKVDEIAKNISELVETLRKPKNNESGVRHKYIDESFPTWIIFGVNPKTGKVSVSDDEGDVVQSITREEAEQLIKWRYAIQEVIYVLIGSDYSKLELAREVYKQRLERDNVPNT